MLTITSAAWELINHALRCSPVTDPVICLLESTTGNKVPPELHQAITGGADEKTIRELAFKWMDPLNEPTYLFPHIYPQAQFPWFFLTTIDGVRFVCPPGKRRAMKRGLLDVGERGLVLKDAAGAVVMPTRRGADDRAYG